jgi:threonine/homoserine/homoserine lactone efflux protein
VCRPSPMHTVLQVFPDFYTLLRYAGAAYMLWIAWKLASARPDLGESAGATRPMGFWGAAAFQWVNPKAWVMAVTAMSTYLPPDAGLPLVLALAAIFLVVGAPCSAFWAAFGQAMRRILQDPVRLRVFNVTMALALVASLYPMLTH